MFPSLKKKKQTRFWELKTEQQILQGHRSGLGLQDGLSSRLLQGPSIRSLQMTLWVSQMPHPSPVWLLPTPASAPVSPAIVWGGREAAGRKAGHNRWMDRSGLCCFNVRAERHRSAVTVYVSHVGSMQWEYKNIWMMWMMPWHLSTTTQQQFYFLSQRKTSWWARNNQLNWSVHEYS